MSGAYKHAPAVLKMGEFYSKIITTDTTVIPQLQRKYRFISKDFFIKYKKFRHTVRGQSPYINFISSDGDVPSGMIGNIVTEVSNLYAIHHIH